MRDRRGRSAPATPCARAGDDVHAGDVLFAAGTVLAPGRRSACWPASAPGVVRGRRPRPRVGVLSTGDELVEDGAPLAPGQIRESNRHDAARRWCAEAGCDAVDLGLVRDDEAALEARPARRRGAAATPSSRSGGVSMGDFDVVKAVLDRIADMRWMQIAIKPAKPFAFGLLAGRHVPVFGLPGNPVSSLVSFELLARPALRQMMGHRQLDRPSVARRRRRRAAAAGPTASPLRAGHRPRSSDDGRFHVALGRRPGQPPAGRDGRGQRAGRRARRRRRRAGRRRRRPPPRRDRRRRVAAGGSP